MNSFLITIDGGTTNTRAVLWNRQGQVVTTAKDDIGVRNTAIDGNNERLKQGVRSLILALLQDAGITITQIQAIYASGMITSNVGLVEIPHLIAPASIEDFAAGVQAVYIPDICPLPIHFIPGLKNLPAKMITLENIESMDIMRGEETEALALLSQIDNTNGCLLVLPGSHTKFVTVDHQGYMTGCLTSLAGEMLSVLTKYSIVADAVNGQFVQQCCDPEYLKAGFHAAQSTSCARAAFLVRIANQFLTKNQNQCASYLLGVVLQNDVASIKTSHALTVNQDMHVLIAGKDPLRTALKTLFLEDGYFSNVNTFAPMQNKPIAGHGALLVAQKRKDFSYEYIK
ncbi:MULTISPECIES: 2-dehydro-3-deoxygalactonokinase [unclassified Lacrimispora]|uniref:2-dehydro-3-deoxygalactonokinase n=1 Tax=unclassified Lacrimispora TaxID=2719232 RepID=UPI00306AC2B9|nr:2-dehydro-3-deoxygalactonokinase [Lachnospiraceae bacterium]